MIKSLLVVAYVVWCAAYLSTVPRCTEFGKMPRYTSCSNGYIAARFVIWPFDVAWSAAAQLAERRLAESAEQ